MAIVAGRHLVLNVTHQCNLACKYCFDVDKKPGVMSPEVVRAAQRAIPWVDGAPGSISFFGGEPLLAWKAIEFAAERFPRANLHVTTNATLITEKMLRLFKLRKFGFIVSLDGPKEIHDAQRVRPDGSGSWDGTMNGLLMLRDAGLGKRVTLRGTFTVEDPRLVERLAFLNSVADKGLAASVALEPAHTPGATHSDEQWVALAKEYRRATQWIMQRAFDGKPYRWRHISKVFGRIVNLTRQTQNCGGGVGYFTVGPAGDIFACHREGDTRVGHVNTGLDQEAISAWHCSRPVDAQAKCSTCGLAYICGGACRYTSVEGCGSLFMADPDTCRHRNLDAKEAYWLASDHRRRGLLSAWAKRR